jgi:hypothetical protein
VLEQEIQELSRSLAAIGFMIVGGSVEDIASWGGTVVFRRAALLLKATNDRSLLMFDVASTSVPEEWYLLSLVNAELEHAQPSDSRGPTAEEVAAIIGRRGADLSELFGPAEWPAFRVRLQERNRAQTAFMVNLLRR